MHLTNSTPIKYMIVGLQVGLGGLHCLPPVDYIQYYDHIMILLFIKHAANNIFGSQATVNMLSTHSGVHSYVALIALGHACRKNFKILYQITETQLGCTAELDLMEQNF